MIFNFNQILVIIVLLTIHYIADFVFQDEDWAKNKSKNNCSLLSHTITYSVILYCIGIILVPLTPLTWKFVLMFSIISFIIHTIQDYITSRITSRMYKEEKYGSKIPNWGFFSMIGLDQDLHFIQLFVTYYLLQPWINI